MAMNQKEQQQLKVELLAMAEEAVTATLQWDTEHPVRTFGEIESFVLDIRRRLGQRLAQVLCEEQAVAQPYPGPPCPDCGREMHYKGTGQRQVGSLVGDITFERRYYHCEHCPRSVFPPR
jgi:hypothetical protein